MNRYIDFHQWEVGQSLPALEKDPLTKTQLVRYAGASGDFNPLHTDDSTAQKAGMKGVIAQGPLVMGFVGQAITQWVPKHQLKRFNVRFMGIAFPGDRITVRATVTEKKYEGDTLRVVCDTKAQDQNGEVKLSGRFEVFVAK